MYLKRQTRVLRDLAPKSELKAQIRAYGFNVSIRERIRGGISLSSELFAQDERSMAYVSIRQQACYATRVILLL